MVLGFVTRFVTVHVVNEIEYPTADEVNDLLTIAEPIVGERHEAYRALLFAARGCIAEARAYARLAEVVK